MIMSLQYGISMLKVNNRSTRKRKEKCSKLTTKNTRVAGIYPPYTISIVWSKEVGIKRFPNLYENF